MARAASAEKLSKAARDHLRMLKAEHRLARKAFKQAKKAAKAARKEAKAAARLIKQAARPKKSAPAKSKAKPARTAKARPRGFARPASADAPATGSDDSQSSATTPL